MKYVDKYYFYLIYVVILFDTELPFISFKANTIPAVEPIYIHSAQLAEDRSTGKVNNRLKALSIRWDAENSLMRLRRVEERTHELKQKADALEAANIELQKLDQLKSEFMSPVSNRFHARSQICVPCWN